MKKGGFIRYCKNIVGEIKKGNFSSLNSFRYYSRWNESLQEGKNSVVDEQPWITFPVIDLLKSRINKTSSVFEFGGGGSTLFFVNRAKEVITVEHDKEWFAILEQKVQQKTKTGWQGNLILPEDAVNTAGLDPAAPEDYFSSDINFQRHTFKAYAASIDRYPDNYFDVVVVDGRVRPSCAVHSIPKIKKGGWLIIDNSDRTFYFEKIKNQLETNFKLVTNEVTLSPYVDFFTRTGVWEKR